MDALQELCHQIFAPYGGMAKVRVGSAVNGCNPRRESQLHGRMRTMVHLPNTHHTLWSDQEMLHEKFIRDFIARQYDEYDDSVEALDMEAVWYNMVELVLGYGGALFRIDPSYVVYAGETTRGSVSRLPDHVASFKVQAMVARQANRNDIMYNLAAPYLRLPQKYKIQGPAKWTA